jgi:hypothetical protein
MSRERSRAAHRNGQGQRTGQSELGALMRGRAARLAGTRQFWLLVALLVAAFALGGGSRGDIVSLIILRPLSVVALGLGLDTLRAADAARHRWLIGLACASIAVVALELVPLTPSLLHALPGRAILDEIDRAAGLEGLWRPLSLSPTLTVNTFWSLFAPLAVIVLAAQLEAAELERLVAAMLLVGLFSTGLAVLQMIGDPDGPAYFYADTNPGSPVGLFANRNHQAAFIASLLPLAAAWVGRDDGARAARHGRAIRLRLLAALALVFTLVPLILITGSRAGLVAGVLALVAVPWIMGPGLRLKVQDVLSTGRHRLWLGGVVGGGIVALTGLTIWFGRAEAVNRLAGLGTGGELRVRTLPSVLRMLGEYFPWGAGWGAFKPVYRAHEMDSVLMPIMMNHAHDDWLEVLALGGLGGALLLTGLVLLWGRAAWRAWAAAGQGRQLRVARAGVVVMAIFALASLSDYPLRVPSLSCYFALAAVWAGGLRSREKTPLAKAAAEALPYASATES